MFDLSALITVFKNNIDYVITILENLGCTNIKKNIKTTGEELRFALPDHHNATCGVVNLDNLYFASFNDEIDYKGTLLGFVQFYKNFNKQQAIIWMCKQVGLNVSQFEQVFPEIKKTCTFGQYIIDAKNKKKAINTTEKDLEFFEISPKYCYIWGPHMDLIREGITPRVQNQFHIGYDLISKRILYPHRYWNGNDDSYVGLIGRTTNPQWELLGIPKYFPLKKYPKSLNLYGLYENKNIKKPDDLTDMQKVFWRTIKDDHYLIVYEAEKSVLKRATWFDYTGVALMGHTLSDVQANIIEGLDDVAEVIFALDNDISVDIVKEQCKKIKTKKTSYIVDKFNILGPKDSPADANPYNFEILLKNRVKNYKNELKKG